ncbi:MAG: hypothetical protein ACRENQ_13795 [Gemmatimonadaceae bacterium]
MGASAAAAIIMAKEKDLVAHFRRLGAVSPAKAKSASELGVEQRLAWSKLVRRDVIREARPGAFYLDEPSWTVARRQRLQLVLMLIVLALIIVLGTMLLSR